MVLFLFSGFLAWKSTGLQLISFYKHIYKSRDASSLSGIVYIDLAKSFDKVSHTKLLHKLSHYGICGDVIIWLKSYLNNRKQRVKINNTFYNYTQVISGVLQGSVISSLLFLIYINDFLIYLIIRLINLYLQMILNCDFRSNPIIVVSFCKILSMVSAIG